MLLLLIPLGLKLGLEGLLVVAPKASLVGKA